MMNGVNQLVLLWSLALLRSAPLTYGLYHRVNHAAHKHHLPSSHPLIISFIPPPPPSHQQQQQQRPHRAAASRTGLLPLWAGWSRTGRAGWRSSGWWCRPVSSSPPPCYPTLWTAFRSLSPPPLRWRKNKNNLPKRPGDKKKETPSLQRNQPAFSYFYFPGSSSGPAPSSSTEPVVWFVSASRSLCAPLRAPGEPARTRPGC